ncbi:LOW QUALITY PROTEIN: spermatogenesis-associated protein 20 [Drosophila gunungcola]|uniref:LOW QUALITY PROTEIN: spermatogenesis-associated protein 20 n=1 Tax=Drosophila gunungcola TaxID=103775 RepID=UPI0022E91FDE|nr:LOW QUALITY PROTEIN: spermatogenesis-associated protein 20 [Drosophila gunungcola]
MFRVRPLFPRIRSTLHTTLKLQPDTSPSEAVSVGIGRDLHLNLRLPHIGCRSRTLSNQNFRGMASGGETPKEASAEAAKDSTEASTSQVTVKEALATGGASQEEPPKQGNRLLSSKSPYLLQHAYNPVDWYPWGDEAFERARSENKLIFLSVGYSTCHWCHVMEHESFESPETAAIMNEHFVNIKVDREERPDIDKVYMQFLLMSKGSGGWPMSVWLTPDLAPLVAGTYFPPKSQYGMPSFQTVLKSIAKKWSSDKESLLKAGTVLLSALQRNQDAAAVADAAFGPGSSGEKLREAINIHKQRFDQSHGGFGSEPKFPEVPRLNFLFHAYSVTKDADVLDMAIQTLDHIGKGGINDHIFGGFARYATTHDWHNVHFEKMLYDQGQLMAAFANAYKMTRNEAFLGYADKIYKYLMKDLRHPLGGFFAGEDADSLPTHEDKVKVEGAFYAWTWDEIEAAFKAQPERFDDITPEKAFEVYAFHYGLKPTGNVPTYSDPHGHLTGKNILIVRGSAEETCSNCSLPAEYFETLLATANDILHALRDKRPRPHLDTKIICAWNGLVLSGLCKLGSCYSANRNQYMQTAKELLEFLRKEMFKPEENLLIRSCYGVALGDETLEKNESQIDGFLDDYAFLIKGLLDYYKATLDIDALHWARTLQDTQNKLFWDERNGAYFFSQEDAPNVIVRLKEDHDGAEPCGNSVSARNLVLLAHYYEENAYQEKAEKLLNFFADVSPFGHALPEMMSALLMHENGLDLVAVVGPDSPSTQRFVEICRKFYIPSMIIVHVDPANPDDSSNHRLQTKFKMVNGKTTVYICHERACRMPVTCPTQLENNLMEFFFSKRD